MMKPRAHYKKPKENKKALFATLRIVLTAGALAILGIIGYYAATQGWEAVFAWFGGKYMCMVVMILVAAGTAAIWLVKLVVSMKRFKEDEQG